MVTPGSYHSQHIIDEYVRLFFEKQKLQWENYALSKDHDLNEIDRKILAAVHEYQSLQERTEGRADQIFKSICAKELIESSSDVSILRNKIDRLKFYSTDLDKSHFKTPHEYKLALGERLENDVLRLMHLRDSLAREFGYPSYKDAIFSLEDLDLHQTKKVVQDYLSSHLQRVRKNIRDFDISWPNWSSDLDRLGASFDFRSEPNTLSRILKKLGFSSMERSVHIHFKQQPLCANAMAISVPDDIRVLMDPKNSPNNFRIFLHEMGHAAAYAFNENQHLFKTWTSSFDEVMAVVFEKIGLKIHGNDSVESAASVSSEIEAVRCSISFLFELDLWDSPHDAKKLYKHHYEQLGIDLGPLEIWAYDSFRSLDPVYIHNYVLGEIVGQSVLNHLIHSYGSNYRRFGEWLRERFYFDGRETTLREKLRRANIEIAV